MARLKATGEDHDTPRCAWTEAFDYAGLFTCAAGNVCANRCPVGIETGTMVIGERARRRTEGERRTAHRVADHTHAVETGLKTGIGAQALSRTIIGNGATDAIAAGMRSLAGTPRVSRALRPGPGAPKARAGANLRADPKTTGFPVPIATQPDNRVVYFPACPTRMFGANKTPYDLLPAPEAMIALLTRAGFDVIVPDDLDGSCCGQPFLSKGFPEEVAARRRPPGRKAGAADRRHAAGADRRLDLRQASEGTPVDADGRRQRRIPARRSAAQADHHPAGARRSPCTTTARPSG